MKSYWVPKIHLLTNLLKHFWKFGELRKIRPFPVLLISSQGDRGYVYSGKMYSPLVDSIAERLTEVGLPCLTLENFMLRNKSKSFFGNVVSADGVLAHSILKNWVKRKLKHYVGFDDNLIVRVWEKVLNRAIPKIIIGLQPTSELCIAAKKKGILVFDLQHGLLSDEGYYGQIYRKNYNQTGWPDCILCWDEGSANWINNKLGDLMKAKVIGNPWFLRFIWPNKNDKLVNSVQKYKVIQKETLTILVSLQWGMNRFIDQHETQIPLGLISYIKESGKEFIWWLRIHPMVMQKQGRKQTFVKFEKLFQQFDNVFWEAICDEPLPIILSQTNLHITLYSSVTIEASWFGIKTALIFTDKCLLYEYFSEQINNGSADIVSADPEAIKQWIDRNKCDCIRPKSVNYMNSDSLDDFIQEMEQYVKKQEELFYD